MLRQLLCCQEIYVQILDFQKWYKNAMEFFTFLRISVNGSYLCSFTLYAIGLFHSVSNFLTFALLTSFPSITFASSLCNAIIYFSYLNFLTFKTTLLVIWLLHTVAVLLLALEKKAISPKWLQNFDANLPFFSFASSLFL